MDGHNEILPWAILEAGTTYLMGYCHNVHARRCYNVDQRSEVTTVLDGDNCHQVRGHCSSITECIIYSTEWSEFDSYFQNELPNMQYAKFLSEVERMAGQLLSMLDSYSY